MTLAPAATADQVARNRLAHDRVARYYPFLHPEIYNPTEQLRLRQALAEAAARLGPTAGRPRALDVGTGRGNLATHLLYLGFEVTAADVSEGCLARVADDLAPYGDRLRTANLNGADLAGFEDDSFDFAGCYSVLHHVPDYAALVAEMARVVRPGGLIFIDHEASEAAWDPDPELVAYRVALSRRYPRNFFSRCLGLPVGLWPWYIPRALASRWRKLREPRFSNEGDLHIWPDDHVEWDRVEAALAAHGAEVLDRASYLICVEMTFPAPVYEAFKDRCGDGTAIVARKRPRPVASGP